MVLFTWFLFQALSGWEILELVDVSRKFDTAFGREVDIVKFNDEIREYDGKVITVTGYVIPITIGSENSYFILSRFPYQSCFFCGQAGPETVVEVYTDKPVSLSADELITVTGTLKLNENDPLHLSFIMEDAIVKN